MTSTYDTVPLLRLLMPSERAFSQGIELASGPRQLPDSKSCAMKENGS